MVSLSQIHESLRAPNFLVTGHKSACHQVSEAGLGRRELTTVSRGATSIFVLFLAPNAGAKLPLSLLTIVGGASLH
jgi:hypothetical protein